MGWVLLAGMLLAAGSTCGAGGFPTLEQLDRAVADHQRYAEQREARIRAIREELAVPPPSTSLEEQYDIWGRLFDEYASYRIDSALHCARMQLEIARGIGDLHRINEAKLIIANEFIPAGMYQECLSLLASIDRPSLPESNLAHYWLVHNTLYESMRQYSFVEEEQDKYRAIAGRYKDSLLVAGYANDYIRAERLHTDRQHEEALQVLLRRYESLPPDSREVGPTAYMISDYYHRLGWSDEEIKWLTVSSVSDMEHAVKEYISLRRLAVLLYEAGDIKRAYAYMIRSLEDAAFCKARLRTIEVNRILPILNKAYLEKIRRERSVLQLALLVNCGLLVFLAVLLLSRRRQRRSLLAVKEELERTNFRLGETNRLLSETSSIKNTYITKLMMECVGYIDKMDQYRHFLNRKALAGDVKGIFRDLKSTLLIDEERKAFYDMFDRTFLQLFPTFIERFNALFPAGEYAAPASSSSEIRLTAEQRIFALVRLGIDDTERIAVLLRYSKSTIYAYRSRTRLKSLDPETFEAEIMSIPSI